MKSPPLVARLLEHVCSSAPFDWQPDETRPGDFAWVLEAGLGPLLHRCCADFDIALLPPWRDPLRSADLTAQVLHGGRIQTALHVFAACEACDVRPVLLKGISTSSDLWPADHMRPMGDIDLLVPMARYAAVEQRLLGSGMQHTDHPEIEGLQHGVPLVHPSNRTVLELHRTLLARTSPFAAGSSLTVEQAWSHTVSSTYHGRTVLRLCPEFQLVYMASSWFADLIQRGVEPSFLPTLFDAAFLMRRDANTLDWDLVLRRLENPFVRAAVHVLVGYLARYGCVTAPATVRKAIAAGPMYDGPVRIAAIRWMLDHHLIGAQRWAHALPPPVPGRYSPVYQFRKRVVDRWLLRH